MRFRGETCQKSGGFHQLERGLRGGRGDARNSDFADLALCSSAASRFSSEGRTTPSRRLLLMKTTRFLAASPDICVHPEIGQSGRSGSLRTQKASTPKPAIRRNAANMVRSLANAWGSVKTP